MRFGSLFSGVGGLDMGLEAAGMECAWQVEIEPFCCEVLARHWPDVPNLGDVTKIEWKDVERVDLICGGFPCQPFSSSGSQRGTVDERWLWPAMARAVRVLRPEFVVVENVAALVADRWAFGWVLADLAACGFHAGWDVLPASIFGAPHRRYRLFLVAHADRAGCGGLEEPYCGPLEAFAKGVGRDDAYGLDVGQRRAAKAAGAVRRMVDGGAEGVDETRRLRALGNAVVPQVARWVGERILEAQSET